MEAVLVGHTLDIVEIFGPQPVGVDEETVDVLLGAVVQPRLVGEAGKGLGGGLVGALGRRGAGPGLGGRRVNVDSGGPLG